jgi:hypothetical protein
MIALPMEIDYCYGIEKHIIRMLHRKREGVLLALNRSVKQAPFRTKKGLLQKRKAHGPG